MIFLRKKSSKNINKIPLDPFGFVVSNEQDLEEEDDFDKDLVLDDEVDVLEPELEHERQQDRESDDDDE